ncbi:hypothetical protein DZF91_25155 [Actinomadura logoneensis]|uniref:Uncharacterized protein n=1 Tax=Actinomadura logoneensis TaxID=2293572 RepID=A0A372JG29_9ACTN|nr:hypothetical protein DZF91_25155 [Actinomadura logoneensis]
MASLLAQESVLPATAALPPGPRPQRPAAPPGPAGGRPPRARTSETPAAQGSDQRDACGRRPPRCRR